MPDTQPRPSDAGWLSLGPASRLVGVDPDTLRRWADEGRVRAFTTPGGHRRFARRSLERLIAARSTDRMPRLASLGATPDRVSRAYRRTYAAEPPHPARSLPGTDDADREAFRRDGRRLVEALLGHLDAATPVAREARERDAFAATEAVARRLAVAGVPLDEAVRLFVAARRPFLDELGTVARRQVDAGRLVDLYEEASGLLDRLLLHLVGCHQAAMRSS